MHPIFTNLITNKDLCLIDQCDLVYVQLRLGEKSMGTCMEMGYAFAKGKMIVSHIEEGHIALSHPFFLSMSTFITSNKDHAFQAVTFLLGKSR